MRVIIIGGVAGGMSAATRLRRLDESAEIIVLEKSGHVSYANCGLPYYVGGVIAEEKDLLLQTPASLHARFRLDVRVSTEVLAINPSKKVVAIKNLINGQTDELDYDKLILSPGASPVVPPIPGIPFGKCPHSKNVKIVPGAPVSLPKYKCQLPGSSKFTVCLTKRKPSTFV